MHGSLEAVEYFDSEAVSTAPFWQKYRVQVPIILLATAGIQYLAGIALQESSLASQTLSYSILIALAANSGGLLWYRKLRLFPGTWRFSFLIPSLAMAWATALVVVTVFRIPYSVVHLGIGVTSAMGLSLLASTWMRRPAPQVFQVISSPRVEAALIELPDLPKEICQYPDEIEDGYGPIIADLRADLSAEWEEALVNATLAGRNVFHIKQISESLMGRVQIDHLSENALGTLAPDEGYGFIKHVIERGIAAVLLVLLAPVFLIAAIAIRIDSVGHPIFQQTRIGLGGKPFTIFKFRTMTERTDGQSRELDMTQDNDPRITRLGHFLRKSRIDELPQIYNVMRGEMSFIGPRPETVQLSQWYRQSIDFYAYRHVVLPGISGWAQVKQGHVTATEDVLRKLQYDLYYIKNFSFWLDVVILLKTVKIMLLKLGAK